MADSSNSLLHCFKFSKKAFGFISRPSVQLKSSRKPYYRLPEELSHLQFSLAEIKAATGNFDEGLIIGTSSFGTVYKRIIVVDDRTFTVAIRRMKFSHNLFRTEVLLLCQLNHLNVESLIGYCDEKEEMILVYEYMNNRSLFDCLYSGDRLIGFGDNPLPWENRLEICIGAARGLHYLHTGVKYVVMHRNVTSKTILLDHDLVPKLSGFFVSKLGPRSMSKALIKKEAPVKGAIGSLDPGYMESDRDHTMHLSRDVYSFGLVLLEVVCGKSEMFQIEGLSSSLTTWAPWYFRNGTIYDKIDPDLKGRIAPECFDKYMEITMCCISDNVDERPSMGEVEVTQEVALELQKKSDSEMRSI